MGYLQAITILSGCNLLAVLGMAVLTGYTGLFSIGHAGFMALGAYMGGILAKELGWHLVPCLIGAGAFAGFISLGIGYPAFRSRLRGDYFAIATLGFAEALRLLLNNIHSIGKINLGGAYGYMDLPLLKNMTFLPDWAVVVIVCLVALYLSHMFVTSQYGMNCIAVRQDESAAEMMGVDLMSTKLLALFVSAFLAAMGGALLAFYFGYINPSFFAIQRSSDLLASVVFGGIQSLIGPFITAILIVAVPQLLLTFALYRFIVYGLLFVVVMVFRPQGLFGYVQMNFDWITRLWRRKPPVAMEQP
jgi:branched-chain amino acid transport system permease protein